NPGASPAGRGGGPAGRTGGGGFAPGGIAPGGIALNPLPGPAPAWRNMSMGAPAATVGSGGAGRGSPFWMFHQSGHFGGSPAPPRVHFEYPNGSPILNAK